MGGWDSWAVGIVGRLGMVRQAHHKAGAPEFRNAEFQIRFQENRPEAGAYVPRNKSMLDKLCKILKNQTHISIVLSASLL
jgi:hypothetical protein